MLTTAAKVLKALRDSYNRKRAMQNFMKEYQKSSDEKYFVERSYAGRFGGIQA